MYILVLIFPEDTSHTSEDMSHKSEDMSHKSEDMSHKSEDMSHKNEDMSHKSEDMSHKSEDMSHKSVYTCMHISYILEDYVHTLCQMYIHAGIYHTLYANWKN
jgi:hypothetical protein